MRRLKRNQREFTYYLYKEKTAETDANGYKTGRWIETYEEGVTAYGCIVYRGSSSVKAYGVEEDFSLAIIPDNPIPVDTKTKIVVGTDTFYVKSCPMTMNEQRIYCK